MTLPQAEKRRRAALDVKIRAGLQGALESATRAVQQYDCACPDCRAFNDALVRRFAGGVWVGNDYGFIVKGSAYYCPTCNRCVYAKD